MEFFEAIEKLAAVRLLKASFVVYPLISATHIAAIGALFTSVALLDLRILGAFADLPQKPFVQLLRRFAVVAFAVAASSGLLMFSVRASHYAQLSVFIAKMCLIALAGGNFLLFLHLSRRDPQARGLVRVLALLSLALWTLVLVCGRFIGFV